MEVDETKPGSTERKSTRVPRRRLRPIRSRLPSIDWNKWHACEHNEQNEPDLEETLQIRDAPLDQLVYAAFTSEQEITPACQEEFLMDIIDVQLEGMREWCSRSIP